MIIYLIGSSGPAQIQDMANALNHNLEMSDVLQVSKQKKHVQINHKIKYARTR
jgi:hypothetical protein